MLRIYAIAAALVLLFGSASMSAQSDPCVTLPSYLVNVARLQYSLNQADSSEWLNQARNFEKNSGGSSGSGSLSGFGLAADGGGGTFNAAERESLLLQSGALSSSTKEELRQEMLTVSKAMEDLVQNCTGRRDVTVVFAEQNPDFAKKFALHITFNPEVDLQRNEAIVVFDQPVRCVWSTTGGNALSAGRQRHTVPLFRPNGALGECVRQETGALSIVTTSPLPILKPTVILPSLNPSRLRQRWGTTIKAHGTPAENGRGWLDGRYTAYIKDQPNGAVTSDPVGKASHLGYVVNVPQKGSYLVAVDYAATTDRPVNVFTAPDVPHDVGVDIFGASKAQAPFARTASPVVPQVARVAVLDLEAGKNVIDLRSASDAGLPDVYSITIVGLDDLPYSQSSPGEAVAKRKKRR